MDAEAYTRLEQLLRLEKVFTRLCDIARSKLLQATEAGKYTLQYHKVTKGKRTRSWTADEDTLIATFGDGIKTEPKPVLLTPAQAEKKFGKAEISAVTSWSEPGLTLAPMSSILNDVSINCNEFD